MAGCGGGSGAGHPASASAAAANGASGATFSATELRGALLTHVNGVKAAAAPASGKYSSLWAASTGKQAKNATQVIPNACAEAVAAGFNPTALAGNTAAAVTFRVAGNAVSEVLIAAPAKAASAVLAGHIPAECARYQEKTQGKTLTYDAREQSVAGVGQQAKVLNVHAAGASAATMWSLIYRGAGFVGTVTVAGSNASEQAVRQLGQQAYAFAAKSLA